MSHLLHCITFCWHKVANLDPLILQCFNISFETFFDKMTVFKSKSSISLFAWQTMTVYYHWLDFRMLRQLFLLAFVALITPIPTNSCGGEGGAGGWDRITRRNLNRHKAKHLENPTNTQFRWDGITRNQTWDKIKLWFNININIL